MCCSEAGRVMPRQGHVTFKLPSPGATVANVGCLGRFIFSSTAFCWCLCYTVRVVVCAAFFSAIISSPVLFSDPVSFPRLPSLFLPSFRFAHTCKQGKGIELGEIWGTLSARLEGGSKDGRVDISRHDVGLVVPHGVLFCRNNFAKIRPLGPLPQQ